MAEDTPQINPTFDAYKTPFSMYFDEGSMKSPFSSLYSGMGTFPSIFPISTEGPSGSSVTNTTQDSSKTSSNMIEALNSVNKFYSEGMKGMYEGIPAKGNEDIRLKLSAITGRPYRTVNVSARDASGMPKERTELDLAGKPYQTRGGIEERKLSEQPSRVGWQGKHSWEAGSEDEKAMRGAIERAAAVKKYGYVLGSQPGQPPAYPMAYNKAFKTEA